MAIFSPTEVLAQQSIFDQLVGEWNHIKENFSIQVRENGDVWMSNAPRARVAGGVIEAGGNFAFEGIDNSGERYRCVYYITFLADDFQSNWRLQSHAGKFDCSSGIFARISKPKKSAVVVFRTRQSSLDLHLTWLDDQWASGCRNGADLWRRFKGAWLSRLAPRRQRVGDPQTTG
ncbi:hypothetical protein MTX26_28945 [Bradyrhizobium sp. ISRA443]|uniref:hypothetical protein n=1 Tax=unclassified Bradyrhizobium TaxID=2631580 RepID=UPI00247AB845|nr:MULTISPECIES: hypothetical protein [unclassified Bradyrhizobium]WGR98246.1 hypothetical protein MTX23_28935 [Bradyrhizobium sp. ISRA436]WGS05135.1 hypothetical protein MTX18_28950 [Bradyrhizobium sp. ISRA437]WGS12020.1 hypothetical protein MTX26_28945 [Bradyrhizobium sp. ISRA443]